MGFFWYILQVLFNKVKILKFKQYMTVLFKELFEYVLKGGKQRKMLKPTVIWISIFVFSINLCSTFYN